MSGELNASFLHLLHNCHPSSAASLANGNDDGVNRGDEDSGGNDSGEDTQYVNNK